MSATRYVEVRLTEREADAVLETLDAVLVGDRYRAQALLRTSMYQAQFKIVQAKVAANKDAADLSPPVLAGVSRPSYPRDAPAGYQWEAVVEGARWMTPAPKSGALCRGTLERYVICRAPAVAALNRGRRTALIASPAWWSYCADHMYGRWVEDGRVMVWRLSEVTEEPTDA